jgi:urea transport system permease protein
MGMYLMRQIGSRGVYGNPLLPDFMVFLNYQAASLVLARLRPCSGSPRIMMLAGAETCWPLRWAGLPSARRVTGVYLSIITQAMTFALMLAFFRNDMGLWRQQRHDRLQGNPGLPGAGRWHACRAVRFVVGGGAGDRAGDLPQPSSASKLRQGADRGARCRDPACASSATGSKASSSSSSRCRPAMSGVAGALYVPQVGIINPSEFAPGNSIEAVLWVAVGGRGTLIGPVIGAFLVNFGKTWLTGALPEFWLFALGALFIVVTLLLPKGIMGLWGQIRDRSQARKAQGSKSGDEKARVPA